MAETTLQSVQERAAVLAVKHGDNPMPVLVSAAAMASFIAERDLHGEYAEWITELRITGATEC